MLVALASAGQGPSNFRQKKIAVVAQPLQFDTLSVVPGTFTASGMTSADYLLQEVRATISWLKKPQHDSILITYRVFPYFLEAPVYRFRYDSIADFFKAAPGVSQTGTKTSGKQEKFIDFGNLSYTGSFGRSLSFGNTQDAVVNGVFNLQLNGMLADSIEVAAAITDNNIPIMPDGTTQQLNEFDQVWLRFKKRNNELNLGDIDLRQQPSYFLGYFKRQQGIALKTIVQPAKNVAVRTIASGAIAKGKFTRNIFNGQEGNQGPYRLRGANNELFFVVLPGTERVYVDGMQQQRGEDQDYIINYNTAEITFTPRQLINKDKRIQVEFEYADRNYLNSLLYLGNEITIGKRLDVNVAYYANTDARNAPINITLTDAQKQFLSGIGDSLQQALFPSAVRDTFSSGKILYALRDTLAAGMPYRVYVYSTSPADAEYALTFSDVGPNRGNYVPAFNAANGKVFQWVAPQNGVPQGSFEPVILLVTPKKAQMGTAMVRYRLKPETVVQAEAALSRWDVNRFSSKHKSDDAGAGFKLQLTDSRKIKGRGADKNLQTNLGYEWVQASFRPLERLRNIEFLRDWGLPFEAAATSEKLPAFSVKLQQQEKQHLQYQYAGYLRGDGYAGHRHTIDHLLTTAGWQSANTFRFTTFSGLGNEGFFLRPTVALSRRFEKWKNLDAGISYGLEHNEVRRQASDSLSPLSFSFRDWNAYLKSDPVKQNRWQLQWFNRANQFAGERAFIPLDEQNTFNLSWERFSSARHQWRIVATYRNLQVKSPGLTNQQSDRSLLGRAEYQLNVLKGALTGNLLYEAGAGQEQRRDFSYVEVPAGRGEFTWMDYNADGIPQLNEFELAPFPDQAKYIRVFTPTNDFVKAAYNTLNYMVQFNPRMLWRNSKVPFQQFMSRWMVQSALQTNRKAISNGSFQFNPFFANLQDTSLIALQVNFSNTLSYNRFSTEWGADVTQVRNLSRQLLTYGLETREVNDYVFRLRKNFGKQFTTEFAARSGTNQLITPNPKFDNRNFFIRSYSAEPRFIYTNATVWRTAVSYRYDHKRAATPGGPLEAGLHSIVLDAKYNVVQSSVLTGKFTFSHIDFTGKTNNTVSFIMLDALQPGRNLLWNLEFTRRLSNAFEVSFNYEGRKAGETKTVHIGRAALRAIL